MNTVKKVVSKALVNALFTLLVVVLAGAVAILLVATVRLLYTANTGVVGPFWVRACVTCVQSAAYGCELVGAVAIFVFVFLSLRGLRNMCIGDWC